jgi:hypothetical protein
MFRRKYLENDMPTLQEKLAALLNRIKNNAYNANQLRNMVQLQQTIAQDIGCANDVTEAMALLGYLFKYEYIKIDPQQGLILNQNKANDIDLLIHS